MILRPDFYEEENVDSPALRRQMGFCEDLPTAIVLFGGDGSKVMYEITERLNAADSPLQLILICGRNEELAARLRARMENARAHRGLHQRSAPADARC